MKQGLGSNIPTTLSEEGQQEGKDYKHLYKENSSMEQVVGFLLLMSSKEEKIEVSTPRATDHNYSRSKIMLTQSVSTKEKMILATMTFGISTSQGKEKRDAGSREQHNTPVYT